MQKRRCRKFLLFYTHIAHQIQRLEKPLLASAEARMIDTSTNQPNTDVMSLIRVYIN